MSVFLFRVKSSAFDRTQAKDGQPLVLHVKPDPLLDSCCAGDIAIICTEVNKSAPACFALSGCHKDTPLRYSATISKYDPSRKDSHLLKFPNGLEQYKNLANKDTKIFSAKEDVIIPASVIVSNECEGMEIIVEKSQYSFQVETPRCNVLQDGELVIESDTEDTQAYRKIEDEQYVMAIQSLITQKATPAPSSPTISSPPSPTDTQATQEAEVPSAPQTPQPPAKTPHTTPKTPQTPQSPQTPAPTAISPPPPPQQSHKPKPSARSKHGSQSRANGHSSSAEKRDNETGNDRDNKKAKLTPSSSPTITPLAEDTKKPKSALSSPLTPSDITPVDLLMHVTSVAGMLKDLDSEHSERLSRLEEEVARLKSRLSIPYTTSAPPSNTTVAQTPSPSPSASPSPSPAITKDSPPFSSAASKKRGRSNRPDEQTPDTPTLTPTPTPTPPTPPQLPPPTFQQKTQKPSDPLHFSSGEFIAVRVDPSSSNDGYWMARVTPGTPKQGLVRVKWFEKYAPLPGWYFMDSREDLVDPLSIFHRNFELVVKPWKNRSGTFIDIFRPLVDLATFDTER